MPNLPGTKISNGIEIVPKHEEKRRTSTLYLQNQCNFEYQNPKTIENSRPTVHKYYFKNQK
jgi:hypothetical protein